MTPDEEKKAVETLRCVSPDEDLLKLAKSTDNSKVTKVSLPVLATVPVR